MTEAVEEQSIFEWIWGVVEGDFNENPTVGQIIANTLLTSIPLVDQAGDARDLAANIKALAWDKRYNEYMVWLAFFFTLIGLVPSLGSLLKGVLKLLWKGAKMDEVLRYMNAMGKGNAVKWLKELQAGKLKQYGKDAATNAKQVIDVCVDMLSKIKDSCPMWLTEFHQNFADLIKTLKIIRSQVDEMLGKITAELEQKLDDLLKQNVDNTAQGSSKSTLMVKQEADPSVKPREGSHLYKKQHKDGYEKDPYTLQPDGKPLGAKVGKMPSEAYGIDKMPKELLNKADEGYPSSLVARKEFRNFSDIKPVELPEGTKIYRVVDEGSAEISQGKSGTYWAYSLPESKSQWRSQYAVKDSWNDNGYYVEYEVPKGQTLKVWEGKTAGQEYRSVDNSEFYLEGGNTQLYVEFGTLGKLEPKLTNWSDVSQ